MDAPLLTSGQAEQGAPHSDHHVEHHHLIEDLRHAAETAGRVAGPGRILGIAYIAASPFLLAAGVLSVMVFDSPIRSTLDQMLRWALVALTMLVLPLCTAAAGCILAFSNSIRSTAPRRVPVALWPLLVIAAILFLFAVHDAAVPQLLQVARRVFTKTASI